MRNGHWSSWSMNTGWGYRYRQCILCGRVDRNWGMKPLIHKGKKSRS